MRDLRIFDPFRVATPDVCLRGDGPLDLRCNGAFLVPFNPDGAGKPDGMLKVLASAGRGWDHISVSCEHRIPTWLEMEYIKRLFFEDHEVAMQLHVSPKDHINKHPFCLHLWRPRSRLKPIPLPPKDLV